MADKSLKSKAITIKGKQYVPVAERIIYFNDNYPNGAIYTEYKVNGETYEFAAEVHPDVSILGRRFTGHSQATIGDGAVNKTSAMENAETSAVGRALAMMGIGVLESVASADEVNKAAGAINHGAIRLASPKSIDWMRDVADKYVPVDMDTDAWIESVLTIPPAQVPQFKVKDAVDKLHEIGTAQAKTAQVTLDTVITDLTDEINLDEVNY